MSAAHKVNLRTPEVMEAVQAQVESHYRSALVELARATGQPLALGDVTVRLAKAFGFCYGVERAIDLAYAAAKVFQGRRICLLGEMIHNPEVNAQLRDLGIETLHETNGSYPLDDLSHEDVVIIPAFGVPVHVMERLQHLQVHQVDTTCGDVMSVWKRVRQYAREQVTSIIHGKAWHEETKATSSRALSADGSSHFLVVYDLAETDLVCDYIRHGGDRAAFLERFRGAHSEGFDPDLHLARVGVANQTTMLRGETEEVQRRVRAAVLDRYGAERAPFHFRVFDTICGATQERQDALADMLRQPMDLLLVVGGYNSSNTSHLAEMGEEVLPTYFIRNAEKILSADEITHYDLHARAEKTSRAWLPPGPVTVGVTAGASCPNNLIEDVIRRVFALRGLDSARLAC
jgi:4-hydroxy-3-methylbut-2-enyl diphosphate reductase